MNTWKSLVLGCALALLLPTSFAQAPGTDSSAGTWALNVAKSTFGSRSPPKSEIRTYSVTSKGTRVVIEDEAANGTKSKTETLLTYDGKPQPVSGDPDYTSVTTKRVDRYVTTADLLRDGKVIGTLRRVVSQDGKTMTINIRLDKANGTTETAMSVYERQ
jgi:hypothetical protein